MPRAALSIIGEADASVQGAPTLRLPTRLLHKYTASYLIIRGITSKE